MFIMLTAIDSGSQCFLKLKESELQEKSELTVSCSEIWQWVITPFIRHDVLHNAAVIWEWSDPQAFDYHIWQMVWEQLAKKVQLDLLSLTPITFYCFYKQTITIFTPKSAAAPIFLFFFSFFFYIVEVVLTQKAALFWRRQIFLLSLILFI